MQPAPIPGTERSYEGPRTKLRLRGKPELLGAIRYGGGIDVDGGRLDDIDRLARWWGIQITTRSLGDGGYRVRGAAPTTLAAAE